MKTWSTWIKAGVRMMISACSTSATTAAIVPDKFNFDTPAGFKHLLAVWALTALIAFMHYVDQSPFPERAEGTSKTA